jgi:hypothetical protein
MMMRTLTLVMMVEKAQNDKDYHEQQLQNNQSLNWSCFHI